MVTQSSARKKDPVDIGAKHQVVQDTTGIHNKHQQILSTALYVNDERDCQRIMNLAVDVFGELGPKQIKRARMHCTLVVGMRDVLSSLERNMFGKCHDMIIYGYTKPNAPVQALLVRCPDTIPSSSTLTHITVATAKNVSWIEEIHTVLESGIVENLPEQKCLTVRGRMGAIVCLQIPRKRQTEQKLYKRRFKDVH